VRPTSATPTPETYLARLGLTLGLEPAGEPAPDEAQAPPRRARSWVADVRRFTTHHAKVLSVAALGAVILATWMVMQARAVPLDTPVATPSWSTPAPVPTPVAPWLVHVLGAVVHPGVVEVPAGARVIDALRAAGGLTGDADPGDLNLAAVLADGCQIIVGTREDPRGEVRQGLDGVPGGGGSAASSLVNLNTATEAQLDTLPGVGPVTAKAILAWRETNGPFTAITQLQEVQGIGPKTFAQIEPYVCL